MTGLPLFLAEGALPQSGEQWVFAGTIATLIAGGVGAVFAWATKGKDKRTDALAESQDARIAAAEKREEGATARMDTALNGMAQLTHVVTELTATVRQLGERIVSLDVKLAAALEETRRANASIESLRENLRDQRR